MLRDYRLDEVLVKDVYCANAYDKDVAYLLSLDTDRLLAGFYENAGLTPKRMRYSGWENMLIGGHTLGHYLTAAAQGYANAAADDEQKNGLFSKIKALADGLSECQDHSQGKPGFVFGATISDINNVELQFDLVEQGKTNIITESWVPWYTVHKILDGLVNAYKLTGYEPALKVASGIGDWTFNRAATWSEETHKTVLGIEYGGINDALYELYMITRKEEHLKAAHAFDEEDLFKKIASGEKNALNNRHANTTIPKFLGALNRYITLGEEASEYLEYVKAFWDMVVEKHTYVTGGNSEWEHFGEDYVLDAERTNCNNETCNTYNMLKMTRKLFMITGEKKYADYYENTFINAILSSQNPETGMTMYFQPMATGFYKVYGEPFNKFWCCTGSGMENFTKLGSSIYFGSEDAITVNMFLSSEVTDDVIGVKLTQEADIPNSDTVKFTVSFDERNAVGEGKDFAVRIRIPDWCEDPTLMVNDKKISIENEYFIAKGTWKDGETFGIKLPLSIEAKGLPDCSNVYAFKYGPVLLSADLGTENMIDGTTGVDVTIPTNKVVESEYLNIENGTVSEFIDDINDHLKKEPFSLHFKMTGTDREITFSPHYLKTRERYGIYWYFLDKSGDADAETERRKWEEKRRESIVDTVQPGYGQYENDELHAMEDNKSVGATANGTSRHAAPGGSFTYHMKAEERDMLLELHLLREDNGKPLVISIGQDEIYNGKNHYTGKEEEYVKEIDIPADLVRKNIEKRNVTGTEVMTVPITVRGGMFVESARLFGFLYMRRK